MRIQPLVVLTIVLWLARATGEGQFSNECFPSQASAALGSSTLSHIAAQSGPWDVVLLWAIFFSVVFGVMAVAFLANGMLVRGMSGWTKVVGRFPDVAPAPGGQVKEYANVRMGNFNFSGSTTLHLTSAGIHIYPQSLGVGGTFIPYSAIRRIVVSRRPAKLPLVDRVMFGDSAQDAYYLIVDYPVHFQVTLVADDFEFIRPFVTAVPMQEDAT